MRIAGVVSLIALLGLVACTRGGDPPAGPDGGPAPDPYTERIAGCLDPPGASASSPGPGGPPPALDGDAGGEVTVDPEAGLRYRAYGDPWEDYDLRWSTPELGLRFTAGQKLRVETGADGTPNWAVVASARMPNLVGDAIVTDLACLGAIAAPDIVDMTGYAGGAGHAEILEQGARTVDGRAAWINVTRYEVGDDRFAAGSELQGVLLVDTDRGVGVVYVSVPDVRPDLDSLVGEVFGSVRVP